MGLKRRELIPQHFELGEVSSHRGGALNKIVNFLFKLEHPSRSTHRRYLRGKSRCEMYETLSKNEDQLDAVENMESDNFELTRCPNKLMREISEEKHVVNENSERNSITEEKNSAEDLSTILNQMRLEEESLRSLQEEEEKLSISGAGLESINSTTEEATSENNANIAVEGDKVEIINEGLEHLEISSRTTESVDASYMDDNSSEQSWMLDPCQTRV
ncbi:hypothetical protein F0562_011487 [Nyssa sinensis]|uniref:Uncharacterized protein n=1 Tax=Nyssa sinensis TaxID=561372 RepID=A0A5J4ZSJ1_9ASTE|nr:hypothetical protein F0562_011487 [Nyssa sinensis]